MDVPSPRDGVMMIMAVPCREDPPWPIVPIKRLSFILLGMLVTFLLPLLEDEGW
jgi:hypothetical protein